MKAFVLAAGAAAVTATLTAPAMAGSIYYDMVLTNACYDAAAFQNASNRSLLLCTRALTQEGHSEHRSAILINRGLLKMAAEDSAGAIEDFNEALRIDPRQPEAWLGKAVEQWKAGDIDGAHRFADRAIALGTRKPALAYFIRGVANEDRGRLKAAYADLNRASQLAPDWSEPKEQLKRYQVVRR